MRDVLLLSPQLLPGLEEEVQTNACTEVDCPDEQAAEDLDDEGGEAALGVEVLGDDVDVLAQVPAGEAEGDDGGLVLQLVGTITKCMSRKSSLYRLCSCFPPWKRKRGFVEESGRGRRNDTYRREEQADGASQEDLLLDGLLLVDGAVEGGTEGKAGHEEHEALVDGLLLHVLVAPTGRVHDGLPVGWDHPWLVHSELRLVSTAGVGGEAEVTRHLVVVWWK